MQISNITWGGGEGDDTDFLLELPAALAAVLSRTNGFILHYGALHVRGVCLKPEWHSLQHAWQGPEALHLIYNSINADDIPFAQDQFGDQFLLRNGAVIRLLAEFDEVQPLSESIETFFQDVEQDIEGFLNVVLERKLEPGQLWLASPPFVLQESGTAANLKPVETLQVIKFHADLATQIRDLPDGAKATIKINLES